MSSDRLVFDLANEVEDVPNIFVRKDWINILDNQNGNYNANQSVIDTSQLSNSNKYMGYREGYLAVPLLLALTNQAATGAKNGAFTPKTSTKSCDFALGLKNWFGSVIHSLTLDYNGTTIIQQTPFINMWNSFKLMTSLSWQDVQSMGPTMGFWPDDALAFTYQSGATAHGKGVCNNTNMAPAYNVLGVKLGKYIAGTKNTVTSSVNINNAYKSGLGNEGLLRRQNYINYDAAGVVGTGQTFANLFTEASSAAMWKSYISTKTNGVDATSSGIFVCSIMSFIHLRHIHSFFNNIPLIKGAFMKLTLNLNNCSTTFTVAQDDETIGATVPGAIAVTSVQNSVGGVNPLMIASRAVSTIGVSSADAGAVVEYYNGSYPLGTTNAAGVDYIASISVGNTCLNSTQVSAAGGAIQGALSRSIYLYVPSYTFNAVFEQAYISSPIKKIMYEDVYQYQVQNVLTGGQINNLLTNGIANLRSVLILPFYSANDAGHLVAAGIPVYQSPHDPAGCGCTSPLALLSNFNVVVSGQNAIYNTERYGFEQFINQTYGCNAINGGLTDGLNSALINQQSWELEYCYYYVDVSRMLPVEQQVPKSVQVIGQNSSTQALDLWCFLAYGCEVSIDILSGSRI